MALKVSRKEFLGVDVLGIPEPDVMAAKMALDFEAAVYVEMKKQGLKQKDLAKAMGVTAATVSKTLSETSNMTFRTAARIANALGCTLDAPTLHTFDVEYHDTMYVAVETASTAVPTVASEGDYWGMDCLEKMRKSNTQSTPGSDRTPIVDESFKEGLAA